MRTNKRVGAIIIKDSKILLIHRFKNGQEYWVLPGGGVEDNETLDEALVREVKEETSLNLISFELLGTSEHEEHQHIFYKCILAKGNSEIGGPEKENSSNNNIYILEWVSLINVQNLNLYPESVKLYLK